MNDNMNIVISELYAFINILGDEYKNKIPKDIYNFIEKISLKNNRIKFDTEIDIVSQFRGKGTLEMISYFNLMYWVSENEKKELLDIYKQNDRKSNEEYDISKIVQKNKNEKSIIPDKSVEIIEVKKESWLKNIFSKIVKKFLG